METILATIPSPDFLYAGIEGAMDAVNANPANYPDSIIVKGGGYKQKYLKYKQKYLQLKNSKNFKHL
jgi:hypothetical protein